MFLLGFIIGACVTIIFELLLIIYLVGDAVTKSEKEDIEWICGSIIYNNWQLPQKKNDSIIVRSFWMWGDYLCQIHFHQLKKDM